MGDGAGAHLRSGGADRSPGGLELAWLRRRPTTSHRRNQTRTDPGLAGGSAQPRRGHGAKPSVEERRWSAADRGARAPAPPGPQSHPGKSPRGSAFLGCLRLSRPAGLPRWPEWGWGGSGLGRLEAAGGPQVPKAREGSRALGAPRYAHRSVLGLKERAQPAQGSISVRVSKAG